MKGEYIVKDIIKDWISLLIIVVLVTYGWKGVEALMIKEIIPNNVDTVVEFILTLSLYGNFKALCKNKLH